VTSPALRRSAASTAVLALALGGALAVAAPAHAAAPTPEPLSPAPGSYIADSTPWIDWSTVTSDITSAPTQIQLAIWQAVRYRVQLLDSEGEVVRPALGDEVPTLTSSSWTVLLPLPDGDYSWRVRALDGPVAGPNFSAWTEPVPFTVDTVDPVVAITSAAGAFGPVDGYPLEFTVDDASPYDYEVFVDGMSVASGSEGDSQPIAVDLDAPSGSDVEIEVVVTDAAGNSGAASTDSVVIAVDAEGPAIEFTAPVDGDTLTGEVEVTGTAVDGSPVPVGGVVAAAEVADGPIALFVAPFDGTACAEEPVELEGALSDGVWSAVLDTADYADGDYCIWLAVADVLGNESVEGIVVTFDNPVAALPDTGTAPASGLLAGLGLLAAGAAVVAVRRRRIA